jgi:hypothetical protein
MAFCNATLCGSKLAPDAFASRMVRLCGDLDHIHPFRVELREALGIGAKRRPSNVGDRRVRGIDGTLSSRLQLR